jgi:hypothetical protein
MRSKGGLHEPGLRQAGDAAGPTQEAFDALVARLVAAESNVTALVQGVSLMNATIHSVSVRAGVLEAQVANADLGRLDVFQTEIATLQTTSGKKYRQIILGGRDTTGGQYNYPFPGVDMNGWIIVTALRWLAADGLTGAADNTVNWTWQDVFEPTFESYAVTFVHGVDSSAYVFLLLFQSP